MNSCAVLLCIFTSQRNANLLGEKRTFVPTDKKMIRTNADLLKYLDHLRIEEQEFFIEEAHAPKTRIIEQDRRYAWVYIIKEGITKCYISDENGKEFIQEFLGAGMEFGELEVFSGKRSFCCIESITPVSTYKISYENFNRLLEEDLRFNKIVMKALASKIGYKAPRHSYQHAYPIEDNILRLQEQYAAFTSVISKQDIANYLGVTTRSLNRALQNLKTKKILPNEN